MRNRENIYDAINKRPIPEGFKSDAPFELEVDKLTDTEDTSVILHGYVKSGVIHVGDKLNIKGLDDVARVYGIRIHYADKKVNINSVRQGDMVRITIRNVDKHKIGIGTIVYK